MRQNADLLLHPIRLRVIQSLAGGRRLSAGELAQRLPDVAPATLYRHINKLADAGVLGVVEERPARGTPERVYALVEGAANLSPEDLANATPEDHLRYFTVFLGGLLGDFSRYLARDSVDLVADGVGYRQVPLWLTDQEFAELGGHLNAALAPIIPNRPGSGRKCRMLTTIVMPTEPTRENTPRTPTPPSRSPASSGAPTSTSSSSAASPSGAGDGPSTSPKSHDASTSGSRTPAGLPPQPVAAPRTPGANWLARQPAHSGSTARISPLCKSEARCTDPVSA
jgi:DNA-binding transcriptional ArsR family regulator